MHTDDGGLPSPVIFLGPTMDQWQAASLVEADFKPPAAMGDITRAVAAHANAIVLVDGVFESGPSVWHKEILYALSKGIPVIGAASMGALRAAELQAHGMHGFGHVFEQYASGAITDDDEVAVEHGPAETGWIQLSDAMIDIRATVGRALSQSVVTSTEAKRILDHAKSCFFKQRNLLASVRAATAGLRDPADIDNLVGWFQNHGHSLKRWDCVSLLQNLPHVLQQADKARQQAQPFVSTSYLNSLKPFGFRRNTGPNT